MSVVVGRRAGRAVRRALDDAAHRLEAHARLLDGYGYQQVLARGFVLARDDSGRPVTSVAQATPGTGLALTFKDGERHEHTFELRLYTADQLMDLLRRAGFTDINAFGGYTGEPYDHEAMRLVVTARKP